MLDIDVLRLPARAVASVSPKRMRTSRHVGGYRMREEASMIRNLGFALGMSVLAASCGFDMMSDHLGQYDQRMVYVRTEIASHASGVTGAALAEVAAVEEGHLTRTLGHMDGMRGDVREMMSCGSMDGSAMMAAMDDVERECRAHRSSMAAITDGAALRAEEGRHQQAMDGMMSRMQMHSQSMMSASGGMRCGH